MASPMQVMDINIKDKLDYCRLVQSVAIGAACTASPTHSDDHREDERGRLIIVDWRQHV